MQNYIQGSPDFSGLIAAHFKKHGGINKLGYDFTDAGTYYYICENNNNMINAISKEAVENTQLINFVITPDPIEVKTIEEACKYSNTIKVLYEQFNDTAYEAITIHYITRLILALIVKMWTNIEKYEVKHFVIRKLDDGDVTLKPVAENIYTGDHIMYNDFIFNDVSQAERFSALYGEHLAAIYDI